MADKKVCLFIAEYNQGDSPPTNWTALISRLVVSPALARFPEFELATLHQLESPDFITSRLIKNVHSADLVIADLTGLSQNVLYSVGIRQTLARPIILIATENTDYVFDLSGERLIEYPLTDPAKAVEQLTAAISSIPFDAGRGLSHQDLARRVAAIADGISELRINSLSEYVQELREISGLLKAEEPELKKDVADLTNQVLSVLAQIDRIIGSSKLGKLVVSGALAALVAQGGMASAACSHCLSRCGTALRHSKLH
jgi:hypothetical protein